ncbi:MAG TPA: Clp protease N-terminal domain-containing protein, partial [Methyloceanibacter sp.]|nr:Clp protease N-terminal domain-containing protein [Methyloceanibacter sp.]
EEVSLDFDYDEEVPGFEASASDCLNRALRIARSLNHMSLSADHLMLALTMDPNARRLIERIGDIVQLREAAMQRLGKMHSRFSTGDSFPSQTSDLVDIRKTAREAASEREQLVAISDLINAFPQANGRLNLRSGRWLQGDHLDGEDRAGPRPAHGRSHDEN